MVGNTLQYFLLTITAFISITTWASLPPPPVNQYLGIPDSRFMEMTYHTCLSCHGDPIKAIAPVKSGYLPDRHHLRVDTPIDEYSASPYPEKSPDGKHKCITCHLLDWVEDSSRPLGGYFQFAQDPADAQFRDCLNCHAQEENERGELIATVHHLTDRAQQANCHICHGSLINDPNGDHRIPDPANNPDDEENHYDISLTTPWPGIGFYNSRVQLRSALEANFSYKLDIPPSPSKEQLRKKEQAEAQIDYIMENFDPPLGETGRRMGNCTYCHYTGTDDISGQVVHINYVNHHGTGVGQPGSGSVHSCDLCHQPSAPPDFTIRGCERCHGMSSLHNIEYDAVGDGIVVGEEEPYFGHIGNQKNCDGCHKNSQNEMVSASRDILATGATIIPEISEISEASMTAGTSTRLILTGSSFTNATISQTGAETSEYTSWLRLVKTDGTTIDIFPDYLSSTHMEVTLPASLETGSYNLAVTKSGSFLENGVSSTTINFLVIPDVTIDEISCDGQVITITGSGFGSYLDSNDSGTSVTNGTGFEKCTVSSWTDSKIIANCHSNIEGPISINSIFGSSTTNAQCKTDQPKWWEIWSWWSSWSWSRR